MEIILKKCEETPKCDLKIMMYFKESTLDKLDESVRKIIFEEEKLDGKFCSMFYLPYSPNEQKYLFVGLGEKDKFDISQIREIGSKVVQKLKTMKNISTARVCFCAIEDKQTALKNFAQGAFIADYDFDKYKSEKTESPQQTLYIGKKSEDDNQIFDRAKYTIEAMNYARDLINEPACAVYPEIVAQKAQSLTGIETRVYNKQQIEEMKMGAFLGVGQGSIHEPKFIHMKYTPNCTPKKKIAIIGKSITFDAGGLDLKPPASMRNMKEDMSGSACVLGIMSVLPKLCPDVEVHGIIASCENMPSGKAYKPGDVLTAKNGKTIEVDNTDAEGRLTLADALCYADELGVDEIIDIATLTGACMVALGSTCAGIFGTNQTLVDTLIDCGKKGGEKMWQLPMFDDYFEPLKSDIADMKNSGSRYGGASGAAVFLSKFVKNENWAHIDIAGTAFVQKSSKEMLKGAAGAGVRTLCEYIMQ